MSVAPFEVHRGGFEILDGQDNRRNRSVVRFEGDRCGRGREKGRIEGEGGRFGGVTDTLGTGCHKWLRGCRVDRASQCRGFTGYKRSTASRRVRDVQEGRSGVILY